MAVQVAELQQWPALRDVPAATVRDALLHHFKLTWVDAFEVLFSKGAAVSQDPGDVKLFLLVQVRPPRPAPAVCAVRAVRVLCTTRPPGCCGGPLRWVPRAGKDSKASWGDVFTYV